MMAGNVKQMTGIYILTILLLAVFFPTPDAHAARWVLVDFGNSPATSLTPYPDWNQVLTHPTLAQYLDPDGNSAHSGVTDVEDIPEGQFAYYGIAGTAPIDLKPGMKIIATFYNRFDWEGNIMARVSFTDFDAPDENDPAKPWYTMATPLFDPSDRIMTFIPVMPNQLFELEYYIADASMVTAQGVPPSAGSRLMVNISKPPNSAFVLTKIELSDEADLTSPSAPTNLKASLTGLTAGLSGNLVRLDWSASTDTGTGAAGISHYLIYRNGVLRDTLTGEQIEYLGDNLHFIDLDVEPNTTYRYEVSAVDRALFGMNPTAAHPERRRGNESPRSAPVQIMTPDWTNTQLINPYLDLRHAGVFRLPYSAEEPFAYASAGLAYRPGGNPGGGDDALQGSLYVFSKYSEYIFEITIPKPAAAGDCESWPVAQILRGPAKPWPAVYGGNTIPNGGGWGEEARAAGLGYHPAANGVDARLYYGVCNIYGTDAAAPPHGSFSLDLSSAAGAWFIGALSPNNVHPALLSKIVFAAPVEWAALHTEGRSLIVGNTFLSGHGGEASHGPSLYAVAPWASGALPANGAALPATELVRYGVGVDMEHRVTGWHMDEFSEGGAWLRHGALSGVAISYRRAIGAHWYSDGSGSFLYELNIPTPELESHGVGSTQWKTGLMLYAPDDLAAVAAGTLEYWKPQPYMVFDLHRFSRKTGGGDGIAGAIALDEANGRLYWIEHNGDPCHEYGYGLIHVFEFVNRPPVKPVSGLMLR